MAFSIKNNTDVLDNYIFRCDKVPLWQCNRNYEPILPEFSMDVDENITESLIEIDEPIDVYYNNDAYPVFSGYIVRKQYKTEKRAFEVTVLHNLAKLQNEYITHDVLHAAIAAGATNKQYRSSDNQGYPGIQLKHLLETMFDIAGLTLDTQDIDNVDLFTWFDPDTSTDMDFLFHHLRVDENMLYAINQPVAAYHTTLDADGDYNLNRISFWDFISYVCSGINNYKECNPDFDKVSGIIMRNTFSTDTAPVAGAIRMLFGENTSYPITSGAVTLYDEDIKKAEQGGWVVDIRIATTRSAYTSVTESGLNSLPIGDTPSNNNIPAYTNMVFLLEKYWEADGYVIAPEIYDYLGNFDIWYNRRAAISKDWETVRAVVAPINLSMALYAKSLFIDLAEQSVEFDQEITQ